MSTEENAAAPIAAPVDPLDEERRAVLAALLEEAPFSGFSGEALRRAAREAGPGEGALAILFPEGVRDALDFWSEAADAEAVERLSREPADLRIRGKVTAGVAHRLEGLEPHREAARRAAAALALPAFAGLAPRLAWRTADAIWRACGDRATDYNHYTKRGILSGVYLSTFAVWLSDASPEGERWRAFLDARIENVMQFEKAKARVTGFDPAGVWRALGAIRYGRAR